MVEEVLEPNLVVHDRLQTFYTLVMNFIVIERLQDLLQPLVAKLLNPLQAVVGQGHSQGLDTGRLLRERQLRV